MGHPAYRARQVWHWLYIRRAPNWAMMQNLPASFRRQLEARYELAPLNTVAISGLVPGTRKILAELRDGEHIEEVLIPSADRRTLCVSCQVGCRYACAFCASGKSGFCRSLEAGEIVGQVMLGSSVYGQRPTNIVYMGMGEPFDNYDAVLKSIRIINEKDGLNIGARHITISTSGVVPGIDRLSGEGLQVELSVSLHAPLDELRDRLMPVNRVYPIAKLMEACSRYAAATKRIITFEYTLINGVNDSPELANALVRLIRNMPARVNLIPLSPVDGFTGETPSEERVSRFAGVLNKAGINATVRVSKGSRISAACGQLRRRFSASGQSDAEMEPLDGGEL